jgi:cytochrome c-type biogenesis protein CcmE
MKLNGLAIIISFVSLTAFNLINTFDFNNPSIKIVSEKKTESKPGETIVYSLMLCSPENLVNFSVTPSIKGSNDDSELKFDFDENTKQASLNYFYVVPDNVQEKKQIEINFLLRDKKSETLKKEIIKII